MGVAIALLLDVCGSSYTKELGTMGARRRTIQTDLGAPIKQPQPLLSGVRVFSSALKWSCAKMALLVWHIPSVVVQAMGELPVAQPAGP